MLRDIPPAYSAGRKAAWHSVLWTTSRKTERQLALHTPPPTLHRTIRSSSGSGTVMAWCAIMSHQEALLHGGPNTAAGGAQIRVGEQEEAVDAGGRDRRREIANRLCLGGRAGAPCRTSEVVANQEGDHFGGLSVEAQALCDRVGLGGTHLGMTRAHGTFANVVQERRQEEKVEALHFGKRLRVGALGRGTGARLLQETDDAKRVLADGVLVDERLGNEAERLTELRHQALQHTPACHLAQNRLYPGGISKHLQEEPSGSVPRRLWR